MNGSHIDLVNAITNIVKKASFRVIGRHVYGHQDYYFVYEELDWWGKRNVDMAQLARSLMFEKRRLKIMSYVKT